MRSDRTVKEPGPPPTPSWDNSTLRSRLDEERPAPGAAVEMLHRLARDRDVTVTSKNRSRWFRRG